jgi:hypothetical protein
MEQWLSGLQPGLDGTWESSVPVDGARDGSPSRGQYAAAALADPDHPALWPGAAGLGAGDGQAHSMEKARGEPGDPGQVGALIADVRALIQMCDSVR